MFSKDEKNLQYTLSQINSIDMLESNRNAIINYFNEKSITGINKNSLIPCMRTLQRIATDNNLKEKKFEDINSQELVNFFNNLKPLPNNLSKKSEIEYSPRTMWLFQSSIKSFLQWSMKTETAPEAVKWVKKNGSQNKRKNSIDILSVEEVKQLIKHATNKRDKAIISILYETGIRISELLGIKRSQLEITEDYFECNVTGKTGTRKIIGIHSLPYLNQWLEELDSNKESIPNKDLIWINLGKLGDNKSKRGKFGQLINRDSINFSVKNTAKKIGIKKRVWLHGLRHSAATRDAKNGYNEMELRLKYGWSKESKIPSNYCHYKFEDLRKKEMIKAGKKIEKEEQNTNIYENKKCFYCKTENPFQSEYCQQCGTPLDAKTLKNNDKQLKAYQVLQKTLDKLSFLEKQGFDLQKFNELLNEWIKST